MRVYLAREYGALNSQPVFESFVDGLSADDDTLVSHHLDADVAVIWSFLFSGRMAGNEKIYRECVERKIPVVILEVGALKRGESWKVGINGINNAAQWIEPFQQNRLQEQFGIQVKPNTSTNEFITIFGQRSDSQQWANMPRMEQWIRDTIQQVQQHSDSPIVVRPHPRDNITDWSFLNNFQNIYFQKPEFVEGTYDSFDHDSIMHRSSLVINASSGPGVQAVLEGIPVLCHSDSLAFDVSIKSPEFINRFEKPTEEQMYSWCQKLSHTEWTTEEIATGTVWKQLQHLLV